MRYPTPIPISVPTSKDAITIAHVFQVTGLFYLLEQAIDLCRLDAGPDH
jgi:hypothetical protein